jgi:hypothetical protein
LGLGAAVEGAGFFLDDLIRNRHPFTGTSPSTWRAQQLLPRAASPILSFLFKE